MTRGARWNARPHPRVVEETRRALDERGPDVLLLSAYLDHYPSVRQLASLAAKRRVPVLLGGPFFNVPGVAGAWLDIEGLTAIVGAEVDFTLPDIVAALIEGGDLLQFAGVYLPDGRSSGQAPPLRSLDALPVPDFTDFPWHHYPNRVIPAMTGRGCGWGQCTFCADVVTANGRTFRSRPLGALLAELEEQSRRHDAKDVIFLDIKLNSDVAMWRGIIEDYQRRLPGGRWVGTVHVEARGDNGLSLDDLRAARAAGMMRTSFGLETGSQRVNNTMAKGTSLDRTSVFMRDAHTAGISVRTTAMVGYPGETAADVAATAAFLRQHARYLDHVTLSRFKAIPGTRFEQLRERSPDATRASSASPGTAAAPARTTATPPRPRGRTAVPSRTSSTRCTTSTAHPFARRPPCSTDSCDNSRPGGPRVIGDFVKRHFDALLAHPAECECGLCAAAALVRVGHVWKIAQAWSGGAAMMRPARYELPDWCPEIVPPGFEPSAAAWQRGVGAGDHQQRRVQQQRAPLRRVLPDASSLTHAVPTICPQLQINPVN